MFNLTFHFSLNGRVLKISLACTLPNEIMFSQSPGLDFGVYCTIHLLTFQRFFLRVENPE